MKAEKTPFWILLGPSLLFITLLLLFCKTAFLLGRPAWMFGLSISIFLGCGISYLAFQELRQREQSLFNSQEKKGKEAEDFRSILDEAHLLYREKIAKLEQEIALLDGENKKRLEERESQLSALQATHTQLHEESIHYKNQASAFQIALDDALDELRSLRQCVYLDQDRQKKMPKDLMNQYQQLRAQFDEKSAVLDQTRRRLFINEGYILAVQKTHELANQEVNKEQETLIQHIDELIGENDHLHEEVALLEKLLISPDKKPAPSKKGKKKLEKMLEFQFENNTSSKS